MGIKNRSSEKKSLNQGLSLNLLSLNQSLTVPKKPSSRYQVSLWFVYWGSAKCVPLVYHLQWIIFLAEIAQDRFSLLEKEEIFDIQQVNLGLTDLLSYMACPHVVAAPGREV